MRNGYYTPHSNPKDLMLLSHAGARQISQRNWIFQHAMFLMWIFRKPINYRHTFINKITFLSVMFHLSGDSLLKKEGL